jgi:rhodanese-related sulfurtransferase
VIKIVGILAVMGLLFLMACRSKGDDLSAEEVQGLINEGATVLDVRSPSEFRGGHLPGAMNIPVQSLRQQLGKLEPRDRPVIVYCKSGQRSAKAKGILGDAGFTRVYNLGGMSAWPLER